MRPRVIPFYLLVVVPAAVAGCGQGAAPSAANPPAVGVTGNAPPAPGGGAGGGVSMTGPRRMLNLGDSYTIGTGVDATQRFPRQLAAAMREKGVNLDAMFVAENGWRTARLSKAIDEAELVAGYDLVTLLIGVNDQFNNGSVETYSK